MADMYDEEFQRYMAIAKRLIAKLRNFNDIRICKRWLSKLSNLNSDDIIVKKNRNHFFKYMLHVLHDGVLEGPFLELPIDEQLHDVTEQKERDCLCGGDRRWRKEVRGEDNATAPFVTHWSKDKRTYIAAKALPGMGALIYMAVAKDPSLGWEMPKNQQN